MHIWMIMRRGTTKNNPPQEDWHDEGHEVIGVVGLSTIKTLVEVTTLKIQNDPLGKEAT